MSLVTSARFAKRSGVVERGTGPTGSREAQQTARWSRQNRFRFGSPQFFMGILPRMRAVWNIFVLLQLVDTAENPVGKRCQGRSARKSDYPGKQDLADWRPFNLAGRDADADK
jgi:hypothetical protein